MLISEVSSRNSVAQSQWHTLW